MIKVLLSTLCSVAEKNENGDTALHVAAALNHGKTVNLLVGAGADSSIKNNAGQTAVDKAREQNHREMAVLLAKVDQGRRFARTRTVVRRRDQLKMARRVQSVPRDDAPAGKVKSVPRDDAPAGKEGASVNEDTQSSDQALNQRIEQVSKAMSSPHNRRKLRRLKDRADSHLRREANRRRARSASPLREDDVAFANGRAYQLYTLYRDKDGTVKQAPASDCHCKPLIKKLENQLKATKMEIRSQIQDIHQEMNTKLGHMDRQSKHQIKALQRMAQERISVEGLECLYHINQRSTIEKLSEERRQARKASELKNWCMSKLQDIEVHLPADPQYFKLLPSASVDQSLMEADPERLPLLSVVSDDSSTSLATYVNVLPSPVFAPYAAAARAHAFDDAISRKYYEVKRDTPTEDQQPASGLRSRIPSLHLPVGRHTVFTRPRPLSGDPRWLPADLQDTDSSEAQAGREGGEFFLSTPSESLSPCSRPPGGDSDLDEAPVPSWRVPRQQAVRGRTLSRAAPQRQAGAGAGSGGGGGGGGVKPLEFFGERLAELSFIQERDNLHAVEVTQRFFETVSTQLERWYERKIQEAQRTAEQRAHLDRSTLMQRISTLEEELHNLRANTHT
ncbi:hypothetical protein ACEWY4_005001 [Coilia grayii]|uniref:Ankyrin repeat domain-containing protein 6 n=1 Tax=Coilia grayii TaxID=363190 RepID=A0ABD1KHP9_9TELE